MQHLLEEHVPTEDLKKFETRYQTELNGGQVSTNAQFDYAWCLIRSKYPSDIRKGILLLEDLCRVSIGLTFDCTFMTNIPICMKRSEITVTPFMVTNFE